MPYLEEQALHDSFNLTVKINDTTANNVNRTARGTMIPVLLCPSDAEYNRTPYSAAASRSGSNGDNWARTNYAANAGRGDIWGPPATDANRALIGPDSPGWNDPCFSRCDGTQYVRHVEASNGRHQQNNLVGEIRAGLGPWRLARRWALGNAGASLITGYGAGGDDNGPNVCNATHKEDDVFSDIVRTRSRKSLCMSCDLGNYFSQATIRSEHSGGAFVAMCDGSVTFVSNDIETSGATLTSPCCTALGLYDCECGR